MASTLDQLEALSAQMDKEESSICDECEYPMLVDFVVNASVGIVLVGEDGIVKWCNNRFATLLAANKKDIIGQNIRERYATNASVVFDKFDNREEIQGIPVTLRRDDGKVVDCMLYSAVHEIDGQWENTRCALIGGEVHDL